MYRINQRKLKCRGFKPAVKLYINLEDEWLKYL